MSIDTTSHPPPETISVRPSRASAEEPAAGEDVRPELSAESLSTATRLSLLALTLLGLALMVTTMVAVFVWREGVFHFGAPGVLMVGGLFAVIWLLQLLFGALLENNDALDRAAHRTWMAVFVLTGPFGLLLYWWLHVWPAPHEPHVEAAAPAGAPRARAT